MTTIDANDPRYEIVLDADGRRKRIVRDGVTMTFNVSLMDAVQRDVATRGYHFTDARPTRITALDGGTGVNSLNRPGFRVLGEMPETGSGDFLDAEAHVANNARQAVFAARRALYDEYDLRKSQEYLTPTGSGEKSMIGSREGDACMLNGFPGTLRKGSDGKLRCIPIDGAAAGYSPAVDAQDGIRRRRKQLRDPQGREAGTEEEEEGMETQNELRQPVNAGDVRALQQDHAARMAKLYDALDVETTNRWRTP